MSVTIGEARDEIEQMFATAWGGATQLVFDDTTAQPDRGNDAHGNPNEFARVTIKHNGGGADGVSNKSFLYHGVVIIQIFTAYGMGQTRSDALLLLAMKAFRGKKTPGGIWFRSVAPHEMGHDGSYFQVNVTATFEYNDRD